MIQFKKSNERGRADHGWLKSHHTFSFADYYDPKHMQFRVLRVINEDFIDGGQGFGTHPHKDMEIFTYVISGSLEHKDSLGTGSVIAPDDIQLMCAGTGVRHSEFNHSPTESVHLLQIWILPGKNNLKPSYQQKTFQPKDKEGRLCLVISHNAREGSLKINQDADIYASVLKKGQSLDFKFADNRHGWIQIVKGEATINNVSLKEGDGASISDEKQMTITCKSSTEFILFDLP